MLKDSYKRYLKEIRGLSDSSVGHYMTALNFISEVLKSRQLVVDDIFEIESISHLDMVREVLFKDLNFKEKDARGHQMYSAGLNNYYRFATGENFNQVGENIIKLDMKIPSKKIHTENYQYIRDKILIKQVIESNNYKCEINSRHETFIAETTKRSYMEGHHIVPLKYQGNFEYSLDVYANVLGVCPSCHRMLHYGVIKDKKIILSAIYHQRKDRFYESGMPMSESEFIYLTTN